ncbi:hypothetical protein DQT32_04110 [Salmonella enterica subsp. enterica serovar Braenderup]|nr:hypothetical protein [Salmonella enterica subsp. enterica serovar Braenderup]
MTTVQTYYILQQKSGKYHAIDSHSLWEYETDIQSAKKFYNFSDAIEDYKRFNSTAILRCTVTAELVHEDDVQKKLCETALAKLSDAEKRALGLI